MIYYKRTTDEKFNDMVDSVNVINQLVEDNIKNIKTLSALDRNYRHLEARCQEQDIIDDGRPLDVFLEAIEAGRDFTGIVFPN